MLGIHVSVLGKEVQREEEITFFSLTIVNYQFFCVIIITSAFYVPILL
jgi:hypothetical protein